MSHYQGGIVLCSVEKQHQKPQPRKENKTNPPISHPSMDPTTKRQISSSSATINNTTDPPPIPDPPLLQPKSILARAQKPHPPKNQSKRGEMERQRPNREKQSNKPSKAPEAEEEPKRVSVSLNGRRRSFCDAKIELSEFFSNVGARVVAVDMAPFMQIHAVSCARKTYNGLNKLSSKTLACTLKKGVRWSLRTGLALYRWD